MLHVLILIWLETVFLTSLLFFKVNLYAFIFPHVSYGLCISEEKILNEYLDYKYATVVVAILLWFEICLKIEPLFNLQVLNSLAIIRK